MRLGDCSGIRRARPGPSEAKPGLKAREPEELANHLLGYADAGISHVQLMLDPNTSAGIEWAAQALEQVDKG